MQDDTKIDVLEDLDDLDHAIIRLKIDGVKIKDIAEKLDHARSTISKRLNKFKVQQALNELQKTALQIILDSQPDAAREIRRQLKKGETDRDKREAAKEILKGVLSDRITVDWDTQKKIQEYLDEDDFGHIVEEEETEE